MSLKNAIISVLRDIDHAFEQARTGRLPASGKGPTRLSRNRTAVPPQQN